MVNYWTSEGDSTDRLLVGCKLIWMTGSKRLATGSSCSAWHLDITCKAFSLQPYGIQRVLGG
jgi:hypothetical protein